MTFQAQAFTHRDPHLVYGGDALLSLVMGLALVVTAEPLTALAGWTVPPSFLMSLGLLLLPWAAFNGWIARTRRAAASTILCNVAVDAAWVAASALLLAVHFGSLSDIGIVLLAGQGVAVGCVLMLKLAGRAALMK